MRSFELSAFEGLAGTEHLAQIVIESVPGTGLPNTVYIDNIYFVNTDGN